MTPNVSWRSSCRYLWDRYSTRSPPEKSGGDAFAELAQWQSNRLVSGRSTVQSCDSAPPKRTNVDRLGEALYRALVYNWVWLSLVERLLWEQKVGGSNPSTQTNQE